MCCASVKLPTAKQQTASLEIHLLGLVDFESAIALQNRLVYEISGRNDQQGALLICEHPPGITIGREGSRSDILVDQQELIAKQLDVRWLNRGGGSLVHAPGQLAVYPILPLDRLAIGLTEYRERIENTVIAMCREQRIAAQRVPYIFDVPKNGASQQNATSHAPGIWCRSGQLATLGIAVKSWVSYHGFFLNVSPSMELMRLVQSNAECDNRAQHRVSSLTVQRMRPTSMPSVRESLIRHFVEQIGYQRFHIYTGHPLLKRTRKKVYVPASA